MLVLTQKENEGEKKIKKEREEKLAELFPERKKKTRQNQRGEKSNN